MDGADEAGICKHPAAKIFDDLGKLRNELGRERKFNLLHLNIRSMQKNFNELTIYLNELNLEKIDIIVLSETFVIEDKSRYSLPNFDIYYSDSKFNRNDGVVVYVRHNLCSTCEIIHLTETNILRCTFRVGDREFGIMGVYRPPSTNLENFLRDL